jgi:hypothetical protein
MMKRVIVIACCALVLAPAAAMAEVYKWKDKSGQTIYSDTPPLSSVPYSTLSGKKSPGAKAAEQAADSTATGAPVADPAKAGAAAPAAAGGKPAVDPAVQKKLLEEKAAKEAERKKYEELKQATEKKAKEQACKDAKSRLAQFQQGGRIYTMNEQGEREYMGDKEIAVGLEQAQADVEANCE